MAKKSTRKIPSMVITINGGGQADIDALCNNEIFSKAVYKEAIASIKDAIETKKKTAILFELDKSEYYVEIIKSEWKQALQSCIDKLIETEDYEMCIQIQDLIDKIK
jgi:uncharacterized protein YqgQ